MVSKTRRRVISVIADLPTDLSAAMFRRMVDSRVRGGGAVVPQYLPFPMAFHVWRGTTKSRRKAFRKLLGRYLELDRLHAQGAERAPMFDAATGRRFTEDMLMQWDVGREHAMFWATHYVALLEGLLERNARDKADDKLWDELHGSIDECNRIIAQYELMVNKLLEKEVTKH